MKVNETKLIINLFITFAFSSFSLSGLALVATIQRLKRAQATFPVYFDVHWVD
ncbi:hypothetical protein ACSS6W_000712 [Trichoderma asperelloides]